LETLIAHGSLAVIAFALTNIDDLLIISVYFADPSFKKSAIVIGQYVGVLTLVFISSAGFALGKFIDPQWLRFLGVVPFLLGAKQLWELFREKEDEDGDTELQSGQSFWKVAAVTIANGGDNIGVYTPLFAKLTLGLFLLYLSVFALMIALWCALAFYLVRHPLIKNTFSKYGHILLPVFLMLLGAWIFIGF